MTIAVRVLVAVVLLGAPAGRSGAQSAAWPDLAHKKTSFWAPAECKTVDRPEPGFSSVEVVATIVNLGTKHVGATWTRVEFQSAPNSDFSRHTPPIDVSGEASVKFGLPSSCFPETFAGRASCQFTVKADAPPESRDELREDNNVWVGSCNWVEP